MFRSFGNEKSWAIIRESKTQRKDLIQSLDPDCQQVHDFPKNDWQYLQGAQAFLDDVNPEGTAEWQSH